MVDCRTGTRILSPSIAASGGSGRERRTRALGQHAPRHQIIIFCQAQGDEFT